MEGKTDSVQGQHPMTQFTAYKGNNAKTNIIQW